MIQRLLTSAIGAGLAAGLVAAALQFTFVEPVLLEAELYESGQRVHQPAAAGGHDHSAHDHSAEPAPTEPAAESHDHAAGTPEHDHPATEAAQGGAADAPTDWKRHSQTGMFTLLLYVGYGAFLVAGMVLAEGLSGHRPTLRQGLVWGIAGFVAVQLAPAFGLPPELPGMAAGDLSARQVWWLATVVVTAAGLWFAAFGRGWPGAAMAVVLIALPHLVGAPHPDSYAGPSPPELASLFAARALGAGLVAWACLGLFAAWLRREPGMQG